MSDIAPREHAMKRPIRRQLSATLAVLLWLFENTESPADRDKISEVRDMLWEERDRRDAETWGDR